MRFEIDARYLTPSEIEMAQLIFKDAINYSTVKIHRGKLFGLPDYSKNAIAPCGEIYFPSHVYDETPDFSQGTATRKVWFIHEMTHVWQYQQGMSIILRGLWTALTGGYIHQKSYQYNPMAHQKLQHYHFEQQAEIISHYFDAEYLEITEHNRPDLYQKHVQDKKLLQGILNDFLENPAQKILCRGVPYRY